MVLQLNGECNGVGSGVCVLPLTSINVAFRCSGIGFDCHYKQLCSICMFQGVLLKNVCIPCFTDYCGNTAFDCEILVQFNISRL